jgi:hypothetical protein
MFLFNMRASRRPLALSVAAVVALVTLTACADDPVAPRRPSAVNPSAADTSARANFDPIYLTVTNSSGGIEVGSLRWAANQITTPNGGWIRFDPKLAGDTITLGKQLHLEYHTIIEAPPQGITLSGNDQHRVVLADVAVELANITVTKGNADTGSAVWSGGLLKLWHSTVQDNRGAGPVLEAEGGWVIVGNSTISRNVGSAALEYEDGANVAIVNSTIAFNTGVGLRYDDGGNIFTKVKLSNSIIANNASNCTSTYGFEYWGTNISSDWSCGEVGIVVADPQLMPLANNGGPTMTHAIPHTSPAFNTGLYCEGNLDQRYVPRDAKCDVGAFEFNDFTKVTITIDNGVKVSSTTGKAMLTGTIKCTRNDTFRLALELHQDQKLNGQVVDVHSATDIPLACSTTAKPWSATMGLVPGEAFQAGAARASAQTFDTPEWATPSSAAGNVKISFSRK